MKWYIVTDLEGACRVQRWSQCDGVEFTPERYEARRFLTAEVNATVAGLFDADPQAEVLVWDGHGGGGLDPTMLDERAELILPGWAIDPPFGLTSEHAGVLVVGMHARAGTPNGCLAHTMSTKVEGYWLNGVEIGELAGRVVMAGGLSDGPVPVLLISGCDLTCAEGAALVPGVLTVPTKYSLGPQTARHRPPAVVHAELRAGAAAAVRSRSKALPVVVPGPFAVRARLAPGASLERYLEYPGTTQIDDQTVEHQTDDLYSTWI